MNRYKLIIDFLTRLRENNNKEWFDAHRSEYKKVRAAYDSLVTEVIEELSSIDPSIAGCNVKGSTFRINRDIRFSKDKNPYKTHMGAYIVPGGKKSGYGGYYLHLEPTDGSGAYKPSAGSFIAVGIYCPSPAALRSIREEIVDCGDQIEKIINQAKEFSLMEMDDSLKRTPRGFDPGTKHDNLLRMRHLLMGRKLAPDFFSYDENVAPHLTQILSPTVGLVRHINRAVEYANQARNC